MAVACAMRWRRALVLAGSFLVIRGTTATSPATALRLSSQTNDAGLKSSLGEYVAVDGSRLNGKPYYTRTATSLPQHGERVLFYSSTDRWSIAKSATDAAASKRAVVMSVERSASSPLGLSYRYYSGEGSWEIDESFAVRLPSRECPSGCVCCFLYAAALVACVVVRVCTLHMLNARHPRAGGRHF